jgi:dTDP-4-dehydrorhamnose 3,5-epimerase
MSTVHVMRFTPLSIGGAVVIDIEPHIDTRGTFARTFCAEEFKANGIPTQYPQCNMSSNRTTGTLRGMHYNREPDGEAKIVRCVRGAIHDVIVDLRANSSTRWEWFGIDLTADNARSLFVPAGCAHGFVTIADTTDVYYHMGAVYRPDAARGFRWDDPAVAIEWPIEPTVISVADASYGDLDLDHFDATL